MTVTSAEPNPHRMESVHRMGGKESDVSGKEGSIGGHSKEPA